MEGKSKKQKKKRDTASGEKEKLPPLPKESKNAVKISNSFSLKGPKATIAVLCSMDKGNSETELVDAINKDVKCSHCCEPHLQSNAGRENCKCNKEINTDNITSQIPQDSIVVNSNSSLEITKNNNDSIEAIPDNVKLELNSSITSQESGRDCPTALPNIKPFQFGECSQNRKYSLDSSILSRHQSWSQNDINLQTVGKSPLEKKSSFFRKKLDRFFKNTSQIFKKSSSSNEAVSRESSIIQPVESLDNPITEIDGIQQPNTLESDELVRSAVTNSECSLAESQSSLVSSQASLRDAHLSQPKLYTSQPLTEKAAGSTNSLSEGYKQDLLALNSRAISVSSGLDNVQESKRRMSKRVNRVTWLASDSVADYFRKIVSDKKSESPRSETAGSSQFGSLARADSKGRRLSYQRAVSGEDPVRHDKRRNRLSDVNEVRPEMLAALAELELTGIPPVRNTAFPPIENYVWGQIEWIHKAPTQFLVEGDHVVVVSNGVELNIAPQQVAVKQWLQSEVSYIKYLQAIVSVYLSTLVALQEKGLLVDVDIDILFSNSMEVFYSTIIFWEVTFSPMIVRAAMQNTYLEATAICAGYARFHEIISSYKKFTRDQTKSTDYFRVLSNNPDFNAYLNWCRNHEMCERLDLRDLLVKPVQRLTRYTMIVNRVLSLTDFEPDRNCYSSMEAYTMLYANEVNRSVRHQEDLDRMDALVEHVEGYKLDFKDTEMNRMFDVHVELNLHMPMHKCSDFFYRHVLLDGDLKFKDSAKDARVGYGIDVRVFLLSDLMLICKKLSKPRGSFTHKMIRPKYMLSKMTVTLCYKTGYNKEIERIVILMKDDLGSSESSFALYDPSDKGPANLKLWDLKLREARITHEIAMEQTRLLTSQFCRSFSHPDIIHDTSSGCTTRATSAMSTGLDEVTTKDLRARYTAMVRYARLNRSTENDSTLASNADSEPSSRISGSHFTLRSPQNPRGSHIRCFQQSNSCSHEEHIHSCPPPETVIPVGQPWQEAPYTNLPLQTPLPYVRVIRRNLPIVLDSALPGGDLPASHSPSRYAEQDSGTSRSSSRQTSDQDWLGTLGSRSSSRQGRVSPMVIRISQEDDVEEFEVEMNPCTPTPTPTPSASSQVLASNDFNLRVDRPTNPLMLSLPNLHTESRVHDFDRRRLVAPSSRPHSSHLLSPDTRGISYPPPTNNRGALKRGFAFSHSVKKRLTKMRHVGSQSTLQSDDSYGRIERVGSLLSPSPAPSVSDTSPFETQSYPPIASQSFPDSWPFNQTHSEPTTSSLVNTTNKQSRNPSTGKLSEGLRKIFTMFDNFISKKK